MVSPLLILGAVGAAAAVAAPKKKGPELAPGIPDNDKTRAYAAAVKLVAAVAGGRVQSGRVFNGITGEQAKGLPRSPILTLKDLPAPPGGWVWSAREGPQASMEPPLPKVGATKQMRGARTWKTYWSLEFQGNSALPGDIMNSPPMEAASYDDPPPHVPAAGYNEMIQKMKEGQFWSPPPGGGHEMVSGIEF